MGGRVPPYPLLSPSRRRTCVDHVTAELGISERRACRVLGQHRSTQRRIPTTPDDEAALTADIIELARQYGRYGYRRITALLRRAVLTVNKKCVERIWRCERLKVPAKQPKRRRLWLNDGSCIRLRPERPNHVWSYDIVADRTHDGKAFRMLCIIDEFTRESLAGVRISSGAPAILFRFYSGRHHSTLKADDPLSGSRLTYIRSSDAGGRNDESNTSVTFGLAFLKS